MRTEIPNEKESPTEFDVWREEKGEKKKKNRK